MLHTYISIAPIDVYKFICGLRLFRCRHLSTKKISMSGLLERTSLCEHDLCIGALYYPYSVFFACGSIFKSGVGMFVLLIWLLHRFGDILVLSLFNTYSLQYTVEQLRKLYRLKFEINFTSWFCRVFFLCLTRMNRVIFCLNAETPHIWNIIVAHALIVLFELCTTKVRYTYIECNYFPIRSLQL